MILAPRSAARRGPHVGLAVLSLLAAGALPGRAAPVADLLAERLSTVVAVEFTMETELDRQVGISFGAVVDREGTVVLPPPAVNARATPTQLKEFRVYRPGRPTTEFASATYLGQDAFTGWHFVRIAPEGREGLRPIGDFVGERDHEEPQLGEDVWGIGLRKKDEDFQPYLLGARISLVQSLPQRTAIALDEVAGPGLPVFDERGAFLGLGATGFAETFVLFSRRQRGGDPIVLANPDETAAFRVAAEVLPHVGRIPADPYGRPLAWLGAHGLQPVTPEVAKFLQLESQAALVVSEVLADSPAQRGGLLERDILLAVDGEPLPRLKPDHVLPAFLDREIARRVPGTPLRLTVLRGSERRELEIVLEDAPRTPREAERRYFERLGWTARQFVYADAIERRTDPAAARGLIAHFVKPSSAAATAGLRTDDWVQQIDGVEVTDFASAAEQLAAIEQDATRSEVVLLVSRGSETAVLRVKLN